MIPRRWLIAVAVASGLLAGVTFFLATQHVEVVVAARDIDVLRPLTADDLETRSLSLDLVPDDVARRLEDVIGLVPRAPIQRGQMIFTRSLGEEAGDFRGGISLPPGLRAVALPISAVNAVGGAIVPGSRVDVLAVPVLGRAPAGRTAELLVSFAVVLDVRGESGSPLVPSAPRSTVVPDRLASVVIGVDPSDEVRFADRIATSVFVLALVGSR